MKKQAKVLEGWPHKATLKKLVLTMKLTALLLTVALTHLYGTSNAQKMTFKGNDVALKQVFTAIEKQTGYYVFGSEDLLCKAKLVTINVADMPLQQFLTLLLKDQPFTYQIKSRTITLAPKATMAASTEPEAAPAVFRPITGRVTDSSGARLEGVSIVQMRQGTIKTYVVSNGKGEFLLDGERGDQLTISMVGFATQTIILDGKSEFTVVMSRSQQKLAEVIVTTYSTGYQKIRPEQSTGAVSVISTKAYESRVNSDFLSGLSGRLPGLMINNDVKFNSKVDGASSSNSLFNIRGISTISGNQDPLIVLDGYPTELSINMINPNEIESVTILKDAAAATIYGVRASNGVIVIQRKQAVAGKARFNFRSTMSIRPKENYARYRWDDNASGINVDYQRETRKAGMNSGAWSNMLRYTGAKTNPVYYTMAQLAASAITDEQATQQFADLSGYNNADDYARLLLRPAVTQTYDLNMSGGTTDALYYIVGRYRRNTLQQVKKDGDEFQLSGRSTLKLAKRLSLELTTDFIKENSFSGLVPTIDMLQPYEQLQDVNGDALPVMVNSRINPFYNQTVISKGLLDDLYYPMNDVSRITEKGKATSNRITANFNYSLATGISLKFGGTFESANSESRYYATEQSYLARQYVNSYTSIDALGKATYIIPKGGYLRQLNTARKGYTVRASLNYDKKVAKDHMINAILGAEVRELVNSGNSAAYFGYNDETLIHLPANYISATQAFSNLIVPSSVLNYNSMVYQLYNNNRYISGFSNIVYTYKGKYSLAGAMRVDQSNLFGTNPKYKYKPLWSLSGNWNLHKEELFNQFHNLSLLKLRGSYGFNGNVAKNALPRVIGKNILNDYAPSQFPALTRAAFANSSLRWEQTEQVNLGLDFGFVNRINGSFEFYHKKSTDLLSNTEINPTLGAGPTYINTASILNKGIEFKIDADWISKAGFNWNTGMFFSSNTSKTLKVYQTLNRYPSAVNDIGYIEGYALGALFAYRYAGMDNAGMPIIKDASGKTYPTADPNSVLWITGTNAGEATKYMGTTIPRFSAGMSNRVDIGNFYVFAKLDYYGGFKVMTPAPDPSVSRPLEGSGNYWKQPGDELKTNVISLAAFSSIGSSWAYKYADMHVVNGDYLTLADLVVSYNFSKYQIIKRAGFSLFELRLQASNLYTVGFNKFNYSMAMGSFAKKYITPTYTVALYTNF